MKRETWPPQREHISELVCMNESPATYKAAYTDRREPTAAMRIGTAAHAMCLGGARLGVFDGEVRRGKAWDQFEADNADKDVIITAPELAQVTKIYEAVMAHPEAGALVKAAQKEVALEWDAFGIKCAGRIDGIVHDGIFDLKTAGSSNPFVFQRRGLYMHMHARMAWYLRGAKENKLPHETARLIAVETRAPFNVTVFKLTPRALEMGEKLLRLWIEKLRACRATNFWPGYVQHTVDFDVPEDVELTFGEEAAWLEGA